MIKPNPKPGFHAVEQLPYIISHKSDVSRDEADRSIDAPWLEIIPLEEELGLDELCPSKPYPLDALGSILNGAARSVQRASSAPDALCGQAILGGANLACAGHYDVLIDGRRYPNTNYLFTVGVTGERKTGADNAALAPHREHEKCLRATYASEPKDQRIPPVLAIGDSTIEGVQALLGQGLSRIGVFTNEAGNILGGWSMQSEQKIRTAASLSKFWDGAPDTRMRGTTGLTILAGRRVTAHFGCQPSIARAFLSDKAMQGQGVAARFLPAWPASKIGQRLYQSVDINNDDNYKSYGNRIAQLLAVPLSLRSERVGELEPPVMHLSAPAKLLWIQFHDAIERDAGAKGSLFTIQFFACKAAEHALRLASILAEVEGLSAISVESMTNAIELTRWYVNEWQRIQSVSRFGSDASDAITLLDWLKERHVHLFATSDVYQKGPGKLRSAKVAHKAVERLAAHNIIREKSFCRDGKEVSGFEVRADV